MITRTITLPAPSEEAARRAVLMHPEYRALRSPRIVRVDVVGISGLVSYQYRLTIEAAL